MRFLRLLVLVAIGTLFLGASAIVAIGMRDKTANADLIVVPGNTVAPDGTPSPRLKARLDVALELYREGRAPLIFVSGGTGKEGFDESVTMANYLSNNGVPPDAIVRDSIGVDTAATARNAATFIRANRLRTAIVATQYFHVPRTKLALERHGVQVVGTRHAPYVELRDFYSIPREAVAYVFYALRR